jgi:hypothetical protein
MDCGSLLPLSAASLLASRALTPQQAVATERQQAAAVQGSAMLASNPLPGKIRVIPRPSVV